VNGCSGTIVSTNKSKVDILGNIHLKRNIPRTGNYLSSKSEVSEFLNLDAEFEKIVGKTIMGSFRLKKVCASEQWL
jgi:hypothetical protein